jgi:hypothetical protein
MTTQIFVASTAFGLATLAAALADDLFEQSDRRILVVTTNTAMPEATPSILEVAGAARLCNRFADVFDYNQAIEPQHPMAWAPRPNDLPILERHLRLLWGVGEDDVHLIVESIQVNPSRALCQIFGDARIDVYADGLMTYGPTRSRLPAALGCRIERLLHLDLVPGVTPLLITEWEVPRVMISTAPMRSVIAEMGVDGGDQGLTDGKAAESAVMVVGQYLAANRLLTDAEEADLYAGMIQGCADAGFTRVIFKPHPSAPPSQVSDLEKAAAGAGIEFVGSDSLELAEAAYARHQVGLVVGCFSTALVTASTIYGLPAARYGTELLLERLSPYHNSNRIPTTIVDAMLPDIRAPRPNSRPAEPPSGYLNALVGAIGYLMQPQLLAGRREEAVQFLATHPSARERYAKRRRLTSLGLPGGLPPVRPAKALLRKVSRELAGLPLIRRWQSTRS